MFVSKSIGSTPAMEGGRWPYPPLARMAANVPISLKHLALTATAAHLDEHALYPPRIRGDIMRFLNTRTGEFVERDPKETEYAILSHVWDSQGEQSYMKLSEIQKRYNLQARCLLHGTKSPPPTAAPPAPPDFSPLPSSVEHSSSAPGVHGPSTPSVSSTSDGAALPSHHLCPADIENERQDDPTTTHTEQPRLSRCLDTVWQFVLLVLLFPAYLQPLPSPDPQDSSPTFDDSRKTSHTPVEPSRDPPPHATEGDRSKTPSCCIWGDPELSSKIREACRVAREAGYDYLWIDSCCIDKSSSSELSESINSMYQWYGRSVECYAYLVDVPPGEDPRSPESKFRSSRWFRRGWTLQELIAPSEVKFLSNDWNIIGTKLTLVDIVDETTTIPWEALLRLEPLDVFSVAERLSWAARRETTRVEDRAYSLFGIFDINMPTLYGEGERAFRRLQEEILRRVPDQSLFAWQYVYQGPDMSEQPIACEVEYTLECIEWSPNVLLASSMNAFGADSRDIHIVPHAVLDQLQLSSLSTIDLLQSRVRTGFPDPSGTSPSSAASTNPAPALF
ncbi:hypothetical protein BD309DRAFT_1084866 [Dichomitus squalens]|nr:hypothetical protein BD309DRAFT_1084866 [Dichomitus squalens]